MIKSLPCVRGGVKIEDFDGGDVKKTISQSLRDSSLYTRELFFKLFKEKFETKCKTRTLSI